jgi:hypothetical protein
MTAAETIVRDTAGCCGQILRQPAEIPQCWMGVAVKKTRDGFAPKAKARPMLVR